MDILDLLARLRLDSSQYEEGLDDAENKANGLGSKLSGAFGTAAKVGAAGVAAAATAVGALTQQATGAFAEYQQLTGGVETLFGTSGDKVMEYADRAFKTAGLSANAYMETVTSFSASLLQSLGGDTDKAADVADRAIIDMSDNANKMGTSMESIQNAYQGFAKQNYTMLDNLKLGYGGTKEEMQRLLDDAGKLAGVEFDMKSYADIIEAIHVIQENMGITGTTAKEAGETISGSAGSVKAAWDNLVAGFANKDADLGKLIGDLVDSAEVALKNMLPAIEQAFIGIGTFVEKIAPVIVDKLPGLINSVLPPLMNAAMKMLDSIVSVLPSAAQEIITTLVNAIVTYGPQLVTGGIEAISQLVIGISQSLPELIPAMVDAILAMVDGLIDNLPLILEAAFQLMVGLAEGLVNAIPKVIERLPEIISAIVKAIIGFVPKIAEAGVNLFTSLVKNLPQIISDIVSSVPEIISSIVGAVGNGVGAMIDAGRNLMAGLGQGIIEKAKSVIDSVKSIGGKIVDGVKGFFGINSPSKLFASIGSSLMEGMAKGVDDNIGMVEDSLDDLGDLVDDFDNDMSTFGSTVSVVTPDTSNVTGGVNATSRTEMLLQEILGALQGMGVTIDGRAFVGAVGQRMNQEFGNMNYYANREVWVS